MRIGFKDHHFTDDEDRPAGGHTFGTGICIAWQNGPLGRGELRREPNGAFVEDVLDAVASRIRFYQEASGGKFACPENEAALVNIEGALRVLDRRTKRREAAGTEGTHVEEAPR